MRTKVDITIDKIWKAYCKEVEYVEKRRFKDILYEINRAISRTIIHEGLTVTLPYRLSTLSIRKKKMEFSKLHFDFAEFNRTGIKSVHLNPHSDEFYATAYWSKSKSPIKHKLAYRFDLCRENKRSLATIMKTENGHQIYEMYK
jgi:hypothetical protein